MMHITNNLLNLIHRKRLSVLLVVTGVTLIAVGLTLVGPVEAKNPQATSPMHPTFKLLDDGGKSVLESNNPVSTMLTCGACHDTTFIANHSFHADLGLSTINAQSKLNTPHTWDISLGAFGRWNPITYRYLSPAGDQRIDLTTADWIKTLGLRHAGGGPASNGRSGAPLSELNEKSSAVETQIVDDSGALQTWDWKKSGTVEMNCFLCHLQTPNNDARMAALKTGEFKWANSATLIGTGIVWQEGDKYLWSKDAFDSEGNLLPKYVTVQDPRSENCGQCHGVVHTDAQTPLTFASLTMQQWSTLTTGQVMSPQKIMNSGLNLSSKEGLDRSWDVHAERVLNCTNCHYSLNNPIYYRDTSSDKPQHLTFDPRRLDLGDYLYRPLHEFAKGQSAQGTLAPELNNTLRRCESCHSIEASHNWLPYKERHAAALSCETCHIPRLYAPALQSVDWTVLRTDSTPQVAYRGMENATASINERTLITGYDPVLLPRQNANGSTSLAPYNLVSAWYWVYGDPARPVPLRELQAVYLNGTAYPPEVLTAFDADKNGTLSEKELFIDRPEKQTFIAGRLKARGLDNARIVGETQPYNINHDVAHGKWAIKECQTCHSNDSRITQSLDLAGRIPGGVMPTFLSLTKSMGSLTQTAQNGTLLFKPSTSSPTYNLYVFGHDAVYWIDWFGILLFFGTLLGVLAHGTLRYLALRRLASHPASVEKVYMYAVYERLWHWLQTAVIIGLLFTGVIIHKPDQFGVLSFGFIVDVHNVLAAILVINAALSLFYHLVSGEIRQYLPKPRGFFNDAIEQVKYYVRGIFKGAPHPFEKVPERKMNPLQQVTYLMILNVLLPAQVITGALMWGVQHVPALAQAFGGLPLLAPVHTLVAWSFASFVVMHVYLTTTGHTPLANIKAMMLGWDEVEAHPKTN